MPEISLEFMADVLGTSQEQVAKAIKDGEEFKPQEDIDTYFKSALEDRVYAAKREVKEQQYSRGKKEALTAKERELREKFELKGSTFEEMFTELQDLGKVKPDLTPEDVRNTEIYKIDTEALREKMTTLQTEKDQVVKDYRTKEVNFKARQLGSSLLSKHKFVTPDWAVDDSMMTDLLYAKLNSGGATIAINEAGELIVVDDKGNQLMDEKTVSPVTFEEHFVKAAGLIFKVAESDGRQSPRNHNEGGQSGQAANEDNFSFKDDIDFMTQLNAMRDPDKKKRFIAFYESSKASA